jgi:oligoendopeptidase F
MSPAPRDEFPLRFVPADADLGDLPQVEALYQRLVERPIDDVAGIEAWLIDRSELDSAMSEEEQGRYIAMTCQTDDAQREKRYLDFVENVLPHLKRWCDKLDRKLAESPAATKLPQRYDVLMRQVRNRIDLFRDENVPLFTEDEKLRTEYQKVCGAMTVEFDGREQTLQEMSKYLEETDRDKRQAAWETVARRRFEDRDRIDAIFDNMVKLRHRIATNADCANYRDYMFRALERFDYSPGDCETYHKAVAETVVPVLRELHARRKRDMGVEALRPWDLSVDARGRAPLKPYSDEAQLIERAREAFERVSPDFAAQFDRMRRDDLLDLSSRKGKAPGGYMTVLERRRLPFIFMNAVGRHDDVHTLLHEGGHAFHAFATRQEPLVAYRNAPIEFAEVASMGMELLCEHHLAVFYDANDLTRARREDLEAVPHILAWIATIDAFQHWIYTHPRHSRDDRTAAWNGVLDRFGGAEDWSGLETYRDAMWHQQLHPFSVPFYYIEYGIAQLGALQVWLNAKKDFGVAVSAYRAGLALGGGKPLPELFEAAGAKFDFSAATIGPVMAAVQKDLATLDA